MLSRFQTSNWTERLTSELSRFTRASDGGPTGFLVAAMLFSCYLIFVEGFR
jgi:hypothetical protein